MCVVIEGGGKFFAFAGIYCDSKEKGPILTVLVDLPMDERGGGMGEPLSSYGGPGFAIL